MKISVLTPSYNRANTIGKLYNSLKSNLKYEVEIEWLIMDDGSTDNTKEVVENYIKEETLIIKYFFQENKGKMSAINSLVEKAEGEYIIECDSDDYFTDMAFKHIVDNCSLEEDIYAFAFLKYNQNNCNIGNLFPNEGHFSTMFDLYFKEGETGEKALVFNSKIRKEYVHRLEKEEKFITEARLYHEMDLKYKIKGFNIPLMICEYKEDGYTKNINEMFNKYPYGYYEYFREIFNQDFTNMLLNKKIYLIKHYILFSYLTKQKHPIKNIKGIGNKILTALLYIPGIVVIKNKWKGEN